MPAAPAKPRRARGRPRKDVPTGTWIDSDVLARRVATIVGTRDEREDGGSDVLNALCRLARRLLGSRFTPEHRRRLQSITLAKKAKASVITRQLVAWRHGIGERDVRRMQSRKAVTHDSTALILKYESEQLLLDTDGKPPKDEDGRPILVLFRPPVCDKEGRPILWVPDDHGRPRRPYGFLDERGQLQPYVANEPLQRRTVTKVRPRVKALYR